MVSSTHPSCVSQSRDFTCPLWQVLLSAKCLCAAFPQQPCWFHRKLPIHSESVVCRSTQRRQWAAFPSNPGPSQLLLRVVVAHAPIWPSAICFWESQAGRDSNSDLQDPNLDWFSTRLFCDWKTLLESISETYGKDLIFLNNINMKNYSF